MTVQGMDSDTEKLHQLGYAQELLRRMGGFSNFAVSFTIISILSGCLTAYGVAMFNGGPIDMNIGWPLVGVMVIIVGLAMAEVCSSYPTAGVSTTGRRSSVARTEQLGAGSPVGSTSSVRSL